MSKGKQWWPLQATLEDGKRVALEFQERLRQKQWLRQDEKPLVYHVYAKEGVYPPLLTSVNEYMQISSNDPPSKNQARTQVLRLLSMMLKWQALLRPDAVVSEPPVVFSLPSLRDPSYQLGLMAFWQQGGKHLSVIVSEHPLQQEGKVRHWVVPQHGSSFRWLTFKTWDEQRKKPSWGKWMFGSNAEKRGWVEQNANQDESNGLVGFSAKTHQEKEMLKYMGAVYRHHDQQWMLPVFWDKEAVLAWMQANKHAPMFQPRVVYQKAKTEAQQHDPSQHHVSKQDLEGLGDGDGGE